jgi:hypothetical protein
LMTMTMAKTDLVPRLTCQENRTDATARENP